MHLKTESDPLSEHDCFAGVFLVSTDVEDDHILSSHIKSMVHGHPRLPQTFFNVLILDI